MKLPLPSLRWAPLLALAACAPPPLAEGGGPAIEILFPASDESVVYCPELIVVVSIDGYELDPDSVGADPVEGEGHWHLMDSNANLATVTDHWFVIEGEQALSAGRHFFTAELVTNDHQSLDPAVVSALVEFNVDAVEGCVGGTTTATAELQ
jgi:hypothetical protein